jgi:hypothetical protein
MHYLPALVKQQSFVRLFQLLDAGKRAKCIGRSRGGLTTKLHLRVIGSGPPVQIELSPRWMNDQPMTELQLNGLPAGADFSADRDTTQIHVSRNRVARSMSIYRW